MPKNLTIVSIAAVGLVAVDAAVAGGMRCGSHIIQDGGRSGPGKYEVLKKCGQPTTKVGNTWIYERGGQKKKVVRFHDSGQISSIQDG